MLYNKSDLLTFLPLFPQSIRKTIFMSIVLVMILCYAGFYFVPILPSQRIAHQPLYNFTEIYSECDKLLTVITLKFLFANMLPFKLE